MQLDTIPTFDDLTPEWFTAAFRSSGILDETTQVTSAELRRLGEGESMMSELYRATLAYDGTTDAPSSAVVKLASPDESERMRATMFKFYDREVLFYREIAPSANMLIPRCYFAQKDPAEPDFVLVIEEIADRTPLDQIEGANLDEARSAVEALADLHASFWNTDLTPHAETFLPYDDPLMHMIIPDVMDGFWGNAREAWAPRFSDDVVELLDRQREFMSAVLDAMGTHKTYLHGDFRADNLMFGADGTLLTLDFQLGSIGAGATDVAYFIAQSMPEELAAAHADELLDQYCARLATHGIDCPREDVDAAYDAALLFFMTIPLSMATEFNLPERGTRLAEAMLLRNAAEISRRNVLGRFG